MKLGLAATVLAGALLTACHGGDQNNITANASNQVAANASAPLFGNAVVAADNATAVAAITPPPSAPALTMQFLAGTWSDDPTCATDAAAFAADGTVIENGQHSTYRIEGHDVTITDPSGQAATIQITPINQNTIASRNGIRIARAIRCPAGTPPSPATPPPAAPSDGGGAATNQATQGGK